MPFKSKAQLRTCYSARPKGWNCDAWLKETKSVCDLPEKVGMPMKFRSIRSGEITKGPIKTGPRGGRYFDITERSGRKVSCIVRVYLKR